ncbi:MAG TPA: hypothetical protein VG889_16685 [Rhizomicrobium sp.]|nr:hypothetical protein [Rhizomicrobium sp.]
MKPAPLLLAAIVLAASAATAAPARVAEARALATAEAACAAKGIAHRSHSPKTTLKHEIWWVSWKEGGGWVLAPVDTRDWVPKSCFTVGVYQRTPPLTAEP